MAKGLPISVKGIILKGDGALLLQEPDGEWELPGGKLEDGEDLEKTLIREIYEETGLNVRSVRFLEYHIRTRDRGRSDLCVAIYCCEANFSSLKDIRLSREHIHAGLFAVYELDDLYLLDIYRQSLKKALS
ncbi:NUDIX domain-containing protein [Luteithermobacter gelatinilyticus]|uniref:NUDIX domain-containing protein n=1 Tax=Luteithermobacter gelatinilyticus TaxID=2582913 RepID=UPI00143D78C3|nr:NUDIX hydrolase [Luteithermobacter gelatinilyticus]